MRKTSLILLSVIILFSLTPLLLNAQNKKEQMEKVLAPFPKAEKGMERHVIELKSKPNESLFRIEIIPGKLINVDCNRHRLIGALTEKNLEGWGYPYYEFNSEGKTVSTMMACHEPNEDKWVSGETLTIPYNSKLPIVVFAPEGFEVKYRIWNAGKEINTVRK